MSEPTLPVLTIIKTCLEAVPVNLSAPDAPTQVRNWADAMEWVNQAISETGAGSP